MVARFSTHPFMRRIDSSPEGGTLMAQAVQEVPGGAVPRASLGDTLTLAVRRRPALLLPFAQPYGDRVPLRAPGFSIFFLYLPDHVRQVLVVQGNKYCK